MLSEIFGFLKKGNKINKELLSSTLKTLERGNPDELFQLLYQFQPSLMAR